MKTLSPALGALVLFVLSSGASSQIARPGTPASAKAALASDVPLVVMPSPDVTGMMAQDEARGQWPFRYGAVLATSLDAQEVGLWEETPEGDLVWRLRIASPGALSIGILFEAFDLPPEGELYLYDPARELVLGAFTEANELPGGALPIQPVPGDEVVIEYIQPRSASGWPRLSVGEVIHDYRGVFTRLGEGTVIALMNCLVDINCPAGDPYQVIKNSVIGLLRGGFVCSGSILNNTAEDGTPYMLTANHCGNMTNAVAVFGYERTGCGSGTATQANTVAGATLRASSGDFDSQLYQLSSPPPAGYEPYYAGWSRANTQPAPGISISHPSGLPRKLALDTGAPANSGRQWLVTWESGKLEGGSSGSPLFNGDGQVIGPACCVSDFNCGSQFAFYGRFNGFWINEGLATWLDPLGSGQTTLDGFDPHNGESLPYNGGNLNPFVYTSTTAPTVGSTWNAEIDASLHPGATSAWIVGHAGASAGMVLSFGELLVDLSTQRIFVSRAPVAAGLSAHSNAIPSDPAFVNLTAFTQGVILGGAVELTNGIELRLR